MLAFVAFEGDAERLLQGGLHAIETHRWDALRRVRVLRARKSQEFGNVLWPFEWNPAREDAARKSGGSARGVWRAR